MKFLVRNLFLVAATLAASSALAESIPSCSDPEVASSARYRVESADFERFDAVSCAPDVESDAVIVLYRFVDASGTHHVAHWYVKQDGKTVLDRSSGVDRVLNIGGARFECPIAC